MKWISITQELPEPQDFLWDGLWSEDALCLVLKKDNSISVARYVKPDAIFPGQWQEFGCWFRGLEYLRKEGKPLEHGEFREQEITHWYLLSQIRLEKGAF